MFYESPYESPYEDTWYDRNLLAADPWFKEMNKTVEGVTTWYHEDPLMREWAISNSSEIHHPPPSCDERRRLEEAMEEDLALINRTQISLAKKRALAAPIRMLPPEILSHIFVFASISSAQDRGNTRALLMRCCRKWREICLATPRMWTSIQLSLHHAGDHQCFASRRVNRLLELSGRSPLFVELSYGSGDFAHPHECDGFHSLCKNAHQWKTLKLSGTDTLLEVAKTANMFENLVDLVVRGNEYSNLGNINISAGLMFSAPSLRSLELGSMIGSLLKFDCPLLEELRILNGGNVYLAKLFNFDENVPQPKKMILSLADTDKTLRSVPASFFHKVEELEVRDWNIQYAWSIFSKMTSRPSLSVPFDPEFPPLEGSVSNFTHLTIRVSRIDIKVATARAAFRAWSNAMPDLQQLSITDNSARTKKVLFCLLETRFKKKEIPYFPTITNLTVSGTSSREKDALLDFSRSRTLAPEGQLKGSIVSPCTITILDYYGTKKTEAATFAELKVAYNKKELRGY